MTALAIRRPRRRRLDPTLLGALVLLAGLATWTMAPLATGALAPVTSDTRIEVTVPVATSVTPGWQTGDASVRLPNVSIPNVPSDVTSAGWKMSTNWANGYEVRIRATTDPALRGQNAVDGKGARSAFADYRTTSCPCPWSGDGFDKAMFGYSVSVVSAGGRTALDTSKWGTAKERKWRGFTKGSYRAYSTAGGTGQYTMAVHLRSMIPAGGTQVEGSYRSGLVVSAHPLL
ncbi:MAG: hypothetical protein JWM98_11 [Thermoleophilia bacterium]|nr:hypothetical protein [Thermoleophilia bacterium]